MPRKTRLKRAASGRFVATKHKARTGHKAKRRRTRSLRAPGEEGDHEYS